MKKLITGAFAIIAAFALNSASAQQIAGAYQFVEPTWDTDAKTVTGGLAGLGNKLSTITASADVLYTFACLTETQENFSTTSQGKNPVTKWHTRTVSVTATQPTQAGITVDEVTKTGNKKLNGSVRFSLTYSHASATTVCPEGDLVEGSLTVVDVTNRKVLANSFEVPVSIL